MTTILTADPLPELAELARELDVALLRGSGAAVRALARVALQRPGRVPALAAAEAVDLSDLLAEGALPEHESAAVLERYGIAFPPRRRASSPEEAAAAAEELGFPVVVKVDGPAHKGAGVVLGIDSREAAAEAAQQLGGRVLVARQVAAGPEVLCGVARDPLYGPLVAIGVGGAAVEALSLTAVALAPLDREAALELIDEAPGLAELASDALAEILVALSRLALDHPEIVEVDLNPVILHADGATPVDALVVVE